ncbi:MAG: ferredoxin family protein [Planctomycetaceae bacterium]
MAKKITVVISQSQGKNPQKRHLEEELAARLLMEPGIDVSVVPHLYDMAADHTGLLFLRSVSGPLVILGWLYPRALRWTLDRQGVRGQEGISLLVDEEDEDAEHAGDEEERESTPIGSVDVPPRKLYAIDLRVEARPDPYLQEIRRIRDENAQQLVSLLGWIGGEPVQPQLERFLNPLPILSDPSPGNGHAINGNGNGHGQGNGHAAATLPADAAEPVPGGLHDFTSQPANRRWYPVIDYSRCTNCMECIDFCLFGVYGVDTLDRILVEAQDNCKKGCPACSRVCPENAIIFPQHKTPAIAGAEGEVAGLKIDLSQLFGGDGKDAVDLAVAERDAELVKDGRDAVGTSVGLPRRQQAQATKPRDELDTLMDDLDSLNV